MQKRRDRKMARVKVKKSKMWEVKHTKTQTRNEPKEKIDNIFKV